MPIFRYTGRNVLGESMEGKIESLNPHGVASWMVSAGITPITITPVADDTRPQWMLGLLGEGAFTEVDLLMFTRQMGTMAKSGVPMLQALSAIQKSTTKPSLMRVLQQIRDDLDKGLELSAALSQHPKLFGEYYINMVRVGEGTGSLVEIFRRLFVQLEFEKNLKQKIKAAVRYPSFVLIFISIAVVILNMYVIPVFAKVFAGAKMTLPLVTQILIGTSNFTANYWWLILGGVAMLVWGIKATLKNPAGRYRWDRFKLKIPIIGNIINKGCIARFAMSLALASRSGVPLRQAFTLVSRVVENTFYEQRILQMRDGVERGESIFRVAQSAGIFLPLELQMISVGEETGEIDDMLEQVASMYQEEVTYEVERLGVTLEPILIAAAACIVMILLLGIFLPMWDMTQLARKR